MNMFGSAVTVLVIGLGSSLAHAADFIPAEAALASRLGSHWYLQPTEQIAREIVTLAESLPVGGAIHLPESIPCGNLDLRGIADNVQITGGWGGTLTLGSGQRGIEVLFSHCNQVIAPGVDRPRDKLHTESQRTFFVSTVIEPAFGRTEPASDLFALFNTGGIHIKADVKNCAWIGGQNAFGKRTVTAEARVDDSLFLWFGLNWNFADYNAHWNPKNAGKDWSGNAQLWFDLKGGGKGTRLYEMIETNYGNPGPGCVFHNCQDLAIYHGSTERASSQGPGVYWLKNCHRVQLGLRGINAFGSNMGDPRNADANRDITIEGGQGNILHAMRTWSNANDVSLWNSDPALQQWMISSQYGQKGVDRTLRFAVTPYYGRPTPAFLATFDAKAAAEAMFARRGQKMATSNMKEWPNPEPVAKLAEKLTAGRHMDAPFNATDEQTFMVGAADLTKSEKPTGKLSAPPSIPPTAAPKTLRMIAFTQQPDFGKALLAAGADATGKTPSDDAFAKVMYGITRAELQKLLDEAAAAEAVIWKLHNTFHDHTKWDAAKVTDNYKANRARIDAALKQILAAKEGRKKAFGEKNATLKQAISDAKKKKDTDAVTKFEAELKAFEASGAGGGNFTVEMPPGTFLLKQPLYLLGGISGLWGAGPDKTTLLTDQPTPLIKMQAPCTVANFSAKGGTVGLALTGHDHHYDMGSPTRKSYIAGQRFYAITFRDQTFAGLHVGNDDPDVMGGAEHDQNMYVNLKFLNTGDYGIFMNGSMLDKWLCLHSEFVGQKKAGISIKFNNLIHGCIVGCQFQDIDGPGIDCLGGNAEIGYRPWEVWIDECEFRECGNATKPAVEHGLAELSAFTHCNVVTKSKAIVAGYAGSPQICQDNVIDVKLIADAPAMKLRAVRTISVARSNGHTFKNVTANGPVTFVNDANADNAFFAKTRERYGKAGEPLKWDTNPMAGELAPQNGWVHPYLFYRCSFGGEKYAYTLLNVDVDAGKVKNTVDLSPFE